MKKEICGNCKFWVYTNYEKSEGECHRYPPKVEYNKHYHNESVTLWPSTYGNSFCGEYKENE